MSIRRKPPCRNSSRRAQIWVPTCDNVLPLHHGIYLRLNVNAHILQRQDPKRLLNLHADLICSSKIQRQRCRWRPRLDNFDAIRRRTRPQPATSKKCDWQQPAKTTVSKVKPLPIGPDPAHTPAYTANLPWSQSQFYPVVAPCLCPPAVQLTNAQQQVADDSSDGDDPPVRVIPHRPGQRTEPQEHEPAESSNGSTRKSRFQQNQRVFVGCDQSHHSLSVRTARPPAVHAVGAALACHQHNATL